MEGRRQIVRAKSGDEIVIELRNGNSYSHAINVLFTHLYDDFMPLAIIRFSPEVTMVNVEEFALPSLPHHITE